MNLALDLVRVAGAIGVILLLCWLMSSDRRAVSWRTVWAGLALQFLLAALVLWSAPGQTMLKGLSDGVTSVVQSSAAGAEFVFGTGYEEHFIAFSIPATIIFFSLLMSHACITTGSCSGWCG